MKTGKMTTKIQTKRKNKITDKSGAERLLFYEIERDITDIIFPHSREYML